jgi:hypothetical protein
VLFSIPITTAIWRKKNKEEHIFTNQKVFGYPKYKLIGKNIIWDVLSPEMKHILLIIGLCECLKCPKTVLIK